MQWKLEQVAQNWSRQMTRSRSWSQRYFIDFLDVSACRILHLHADSRQARRPPTEANNQPPTSLTSHTGQRPGRFRWFPVSQLCRTAGQTGKTGSGPHSFQLEHFPFTHWNTSPRHYSIGERTHAHTTHTQILIRKAKLRSYNHLQHD